MLAGKFGKNLAVENDVVLLQAADELGVGRAVEASARIDADLLQPTVVTLLELAVTVGVGAGLGRSGFSESDFALAPPHHSFGAGQDILASLDAMHSTFYARHRLGVRHE